MAVTKELHGKLSSTFMKWRQIKSTNYGWHLQVQMSPNYRFECFHFGINQLSVFTFYFLSHPMMFLVWNLKVRVNDPKQDPPLFTTGVIGKDNAIARHGIHGLYWLFSIDVPSLRLENGINTIFLTQAMATGSLALFQGIMYDYIRLEGPNPSPPIKEY